ncbi:hypothetical protein [Oceanicoccus sp. KOV_DT_Chl]|nr:hypothetical protein [Oceanicoccus sp. KOV_DT_Chl]
MRNYMINLCGISLPSFAGNLVFEVEEIIVEESAQWTDCCWAENNE